ncbi:alpha/beta fold hydrolase [Sphaerisporangium sp. TRM90804]|uniref:alpha/beta fold hydrolase n=1 Tax=Sphaerisporangium sp. TRM90804 TaxID=3031113 RepID=UPI002448176D|nr:alpha/beta fold hydrolase [Sphaerisporangium sp. TRM90804]MDH2429011.1 alpha/beta fold hydrolase [Sphaerisporangium sp. TRM90804]
MPHLPGMAVTGHEFAVPLDHGARDGASITVFAREVVDPARAGEALPWLLFLQGGPGGKGPRPTGPDGWLGRALRTHRVLLLDQRGTGRSTPVTAATAARLGDGLAGYLRHFRADSIVRDAEIIRRKLCGGRPWETLGQSYGGFITLTYLSLAPEGLRACYVTGGLPGLTATADEVYARTYPRVRGKVADYYARYPEDAATVTAVAEHLAERDVRLPDGDRLTVRRLQMLGAGLGMGSGAERLHWLFDEVWDGPELSDVFLHEVAAQTSFPGNPLYGLFQEAIYAQGDAPTRWAAERALQRLPEFAPGAEPTLFTGEMFYPWMFEEIRTLRPFRDAANALAEAGDWPPLYDAGRLAANEVPVAALVYHDDMYVDADLSLRTARAVGGLRWWITNEWEHDGVRTAGDRVLSRLMDLAAGRA